MFHFLMPSNFYIASVFKSNLSPELVLYKIPDIGMGIFLLVKIKTSTVFYSCLD